MAAAGGQHGLATVESGKLPADLQRCTRDCVKRCLRVVSMRTRAAPAPIGAPTPEVAFRGRYDGLVLQFCERFVR